MRQWRNSVAAALAAVIAPLALTSPSFADQVSDGQWYHQFLNTAQAHQFTQGEGVTVAVIDTGVDATHPDLTDSVVAGTDLTEAAAGDGRIDTDGHGTKMASLIAAHGRVQGVAPRAKILPIRVSATRESRGDRFAVGIEWAVANGAKVISISGGGDGNLLERQKVQAALAADVVVVAGVGNRPNGNSVRFPAAFPGVVAAAAVGKDGEHAPISITGPEVVVASPGVDISGALPGGKYTVSTGTSDATAITAGAVALIRARFPQLKAADVIKRLTATAIDKGSPGRDPEYGYGVLNLVGALTADVPVATDGPSSSSSVSKAPGAGNGPSPQDGTPWVLLAVFGAAGIALVVAVIAFVGWARGRRRSGVP